VTDVVVGIAAGELTQFNAARGLPERTAEVDRPFSVGNELGWIGVWCFLVAGATTALAVVMRVGRRALPGAVVLLVAAVLFTGGWHIYWPAGVVTMLVLAVGLGLLAAAIPRPAAAR
jgi:Kef-type K+ transport system membrane component KefB